MAWRPGISQCGNCAIVADGEEIILYQCAATKPLRQIGTHGLAPKENHRPGEPFRLTALWDRLERLSDQWDAALVYKVEPAIEFGPHRTRGTVQTWRRAMTDFFSPRSRWAALAKSKREIVCPALTWASSSATVGPSLGPLLMMPSIMP